MKFTDQPFIPVLLGGDTNAYSMARAFYEAYGVRAEVLAKFRAGFCAESKLLRYHVDEHNDTEEAVLKNVTDIARGNMGKTILLLGCGDNYITLCAKLKHQFPANVMVPYVEYNQMMELVHKAKFYELCAAHGVDYPKTVAWTRDMGFDFDLPFDPPYAVKSAESTEYWKHPFDGQKKAFTAKSREEVVEILRSIDNSGYKDSVIIQDFIPGDDSFMRVLTGYSGRDGKVQMMCLGHVLLEEHAPHAIGNHACIMTASEPELCETIRALLEAIGYQGFFNLDLKFDKRDGKFKVFELNCRQGRSNYYVTAAGENLARVLVEDLVNDHPAEFHLVDNPFLWHVVPLDICFDYTPSQYHRQMRRLIDLDKVENPLIHPQDRGIRRMLRIQKDAVRMRGLYAEHYEKPN